MNQSGKQDQVLLKSMAKAQALLKEAQSTRSDKLVFMLTLWKAAAETEYIAFRIASTLGFEDYSATNMDENQGGDQLEIAEQLLKEAQKLLVQQPKQSYDSVRKTVTILRKLYGAEEKGKKEDAPETIDE